MTQPGPPVPVPPWRPGGTPPPPPVGPVPPSGRGSRPLPGRPDPAVPAALRWANPAQLTPTHPLRPRWSVIDVVLAAAAFIVLPILIGLVLGPVIVRLVGRAALDEGAGVFISLVLTWAVLLGAALISSRTRGFGSLARDFGLRFRWIDLLIGLLASVGLRLVSVVVAVIVVLLTGGNTAPLQSNGDLFLAGSSTFWLVVNAGIGASLVSPLLEELFFRGLILRAVQNQVWLGRWRRQPELAASAQPAPAGSGRSTRPVGPLRVRPATVKRPLVRASVIAALVSAVLFGCAHLGQLDDPRSVLVQFGSIFCIGLVNAGLTLWFGRLGPAVLTHLWFNGTSIVLALLLQGAGLGT
ncbi:CPBP family intramembrane glutamic endopeptidase [Tersicoccus sp. MR15.9]|uniref:CPBP family intramembrane glutamic endopeptidase n=1 Tax=Tersicoccus mangrovi TaxID=3121635 RepID=UPI002FE6B7E0